MPILLAGLGDPRASDWILRSPGFARRPSSDLHAWHDRGSAVAIGVCGPSDAASLREARGFVAGVVGRIDGTTNAADAVLEAYATQRLAGLSHLRGDYTFALWDPEEHSLLVGCDAVGLRAPAYVSQGGLFALSSAATILLEHPAVRPAWDPSSLAHALSGLWCRTATATAFRGVRRLAGGQAIRVSRNGVTPFAGDALAFRDPLLGDVHDAVRALGETVDRAVESADLAGKRCVALSGGLDSCVVATSLAKREPELHAFSLVAPPDGPGDMPALRSLVAALPAVRHHEVHLTGDETLASRSLPLADDPVCAGPVMQPGRVVLLRAIREAGFATVFDGEGADELFDILWRPGDIARDMAVIPLVAGLARRGRRRAFVHDLLWASTGPLFAILSDRILRDLRASRPWMRATFWLSLPFEEAWEEAVALSRARSARERLPEVLGGHARYWRVQELARQSAGVRGVSPFLERSVVELVGSLRPRVAVDLRHRKVLLRRLAAERVPPPVAWRPKKEPLSDWLLQRWVAGGENVARTVDQIKRSRLLAEHADAQVFAASAMQAARMLRPTELGAAIVQFAAVADWVTALEDAGLLAG